MIEAQALGRGTAVLTWPMRPSSSAASSQSTSRSGSTLQQRTWLMLLTAVVGSPPSMMFCRFVRTWPKTF